MSFSQNNFRNNFGSNNNMMGVMPNNMMNGMNGINNMNGMNKQTKPRKRFFDKNLSRNDTKWKTT